MAATPKNGVMTFLGLASKRPYTVSVYISDVAAARATFSQQGSAGSSSDTYVRFNEPVVLTDFSMTTGTADTKNVVMLADGNTIPGSLLDYVAHVSTSPQRPRLSLGFQAGRLISALQNA